jgi:FAD/FMN-containing dehydrogenase
MEMTSVNHANLTTLQDQISGEVLLPGDEGYDQARAVWNAMVDRKPQLIVRCTSPGDVAAALRYGRENDLEIAVRGGGHSVIGHAVPEDGLMIDLTPLNQVRIDPARRRAWVKGGALLGALDRASLPHGLATTAGNVSHTGVGGLTLGGGMGWLARQHGLSCDNVTSFEVVTADGRTGVRKREGEPRPVLGPARRRRELRGGHRVRVRTAPGHWTHTDRRSLVHRRRRASRDARLARSHRDVAARGDVDRVDRRHRR